MRFRGMTQCCLLLFGGCLVSPVHADTLHERVALSLSGPDCSSSRPAVAAEVARVSGVTRVDPDSVPEHVLVDAARAPDLPQALLDAAARGVPSGARCRVEIMKSCITANASSPAR